MIQIRMKTTSREKCEKLKEKNLARFWKKNPKMFLRSETESENISTKMINIKGEEDSNSISSRRRSYFKFHSWKQFTHGVVFITRIRGVSKMM